MIEQSETNIVSQNRDKNTHVFNVEEGLANDQPRVNPPVNIVAKGNPPETGQFVRKPRRFTYPSGSRVLEGYTIKRGIGIGGFGEVYFAISDAGKEVALKRIQRNLDVEIRGVRQCLNLKHINLIALWDIRQDTEGESWVVMEYVPGDSLRDVLERNPSGVQLDDAKRWFSEILSGVNYLHDRGIVHRDLKPGNIFYDQDEAIVKIGDYGLSKFISTSKRDGQTESVGTFHYMAPEIGKGTYGKEIDIYSLGIILCEVLTGNVPFDGESGQEIIMKHLTEHPKLDFVPERFRPVIHRALAKDPLRRFDNVQQMQEMLQWSDSIIVVQSGSSAEEPVSDNNPAEPDSVSGGKIDPMWIRDEEPYFISDEPEAPRIHSRSTVANHENDASDDEIQLGELNDRSQAGKRPSTPNTPDGRFKHDPSQSRRPSGNSGRPIVLDRHNAGISVIRSQTFPAREPTSQNQSPARSDRNNQDWWDGMGGTPLKAILLVVLGIIVLVNSHWLIPASIAFGVLYLCYFGVQQFRLNIDKAPKSDGTVIRPFSTKECQQIVDRQLRQKRLGVPLSEKAMEALGSTLAAFMVAAIATLVAVGFSGFSWENTAETISLFSWITATATIGAGVTIFFSKAMESSEGNQWIRRFLMMAAGLVVGLVSYSLYEGFFISTIILPNEIQQLQQSVWMLESSTELMRFLTFFGLWFALIRWWKLGDPLRKTQFSILLILTHAVLSVALAVATSFPVLWALIIGTAMSAAVQMTTTWVKAQERESLTFDVMHSSGS